MSAPDQACTARELTPRGAGAVAVIALSGPGALARLRRAAPEARLEPGRLALVELDLGGERVDEALALVFSEGDLELHLHASRPLVERALAEFGMPCSAARALALEERARALASVAPSEAGARILLDQAEGALRRELESLLSLPIVELEPRIAELTERARIARFACAPARVAIAGPVNAGKSTLFNRLVGARRTIESPEPGTTRDAVRERVFLGAYPVDLYDTAGVRPPAGETPTRPDDELERAGQALARAVREESDLVLWLSPAGGPRAPAGSTPTVELLGRADEASGEARARSAWSVAPLSHGALAARTVEAAFRAVLGLPSAPWPHGRGVPFEPEQVAELARWPELSPAQRRDSLRLLFAVRIDPRVDRGALAR